MPTNNFKLFDENKANLLTDTEYANATQRLNGVQTGVASSQLNNKFAYQVSLVAYSIAQLMNANGLDASDTLAVSAFVGNLQGALLQKVADKATTAEAAAGVLSNKYITPETMKAAALLLSGGVMSGMLDMGNNRITNLGTPTADSDAVTKAYVDGSGSNPLLGMTKVATFTNNSEISKSFDTTKLAKINVKLNLSNVSLSRTDQLTMLFGTSGAFITLIHNGYQVVFSKLDILLTFIPTSIQGNVLLFQSPNQFTQQYLIEPNTKYSKLQINNSFTGTIELYAKWYK